MSARDDETEVTDPRMAIPVSAELDELGLGLLPDGVRHAASVVLEDFPVIAIRIGTKKPVHPAGSELPNHREYWLRSVAEVEDVYLDEPWGCQFAVMTGVPNSEGVCMVVLDADVDGQWSLLDSLLAEAGPEAIAWAADTLKVQRFRDRAHFYGVVRIEDCPPSASLISEKLADESIKTLIEWRGTGGYVLLPGAKHPDGQRYQITRSAPPLPVPHGLIELVRSKARPKPAVVGAKPTEVTAMTSPQQTGELAYEDLDDAAKARVDAYTAGALDGITADLEASHAWPKGKSDERGRGWDKLQADAAFRLARLVLAEWNQLGVDEAYETFITSAPTDAGWTAAKREAKWRSQWALAVRKGRALYPADDTELPLSIEFSSDQQLGQSPAPVQPAQAAQPAQMTQMAQRRMHVRQASDITMKRMRFLWQDRIPLGVLAILAGRGGIGKSTIADSLAALTTRGELPGESYGEPRNVLVCASEESWESVITPRLAGMGADLSRVLQLTVTENDHPGSLSLPQDLGELEHVIAEYEAALVVLSPLVSQLGPRIDAHITKDVRLALDPITAIAERTKATILGIIHPNKSRSTDPFSLIGLSGAFQDVARVVLLAVEDPENPDAAVLGVSKTNMGRRGMLLGYRIEEASFEVSDGIATVPRVLWGDERPGLVEDVLVALQRRRDGRTTKTDEAGEWLWGYLLMHGGAAFHEDIITDGEVARYSADILRRARTASKIQTRRTPWSPASTVWVLPDPKGKRTGQVRVKPTTITPIDPESARGYDGPGQVVGPDHHGRWLVIEW